MIDFDAEWRYLQQTTKPPDDCRRWNKKAARYDSRDAKNLYAQEFLRLADVRKGESVFDMGCGTGPLAVSLAEAGHGVIAADFSKGMLEKLSENMQLHSVPRAQDVNNVAPGSVLPVLMSWEDDWSNFGLRENMVDVAFASRSISVLDLRAALRKLSAIARRRCCVTITTGTSPRVDTRLLKELGIPVSPNRDYIYAFGMLAQAGFEPEVHFIHSQRLDTYESAQEAFEDFSRSIDVGAPRLSSAERQQAYQRLRAWVDRHLIDNPDAGKPDKKGYAQGPLKLDYSRVVPWAFISWDAKQGEL